MQQVLILITLICISEGLKEYCIHTNLNYCLLLFAQKFAHVISIQNVQNPSTNLVLHISQHPSVQLL